EEHKAQIAAVGKSIADLPEIPELPAERVGLPHVMKALLDSLSEKVERVEKMAQGCMKFAGHWDEDGEYMQGATVTCKIALWVALEDNPRGAPHEPNSGWKMCL